MSFLSKFRQVEGTKLSFFVHCERNAMKHGNLFSIIKLAVKKRNYFCRQGAMAQSYYIFYLIGILRGLSAKLFQTIKVATSSTTVIASATQ
jgi:hypothetical protein